MPLGSLVGDFVGKRFERHNTTRTDFAWTTAQNALTDDSVLTLATCSAVLGDGDYRSAYRVHVQRFPGVGYGPAFERWARGPDTLGTPRSRGCGASIRVAPLGWAFPDLSKVLHEAEQSARSTHDHPAAVAGAKAIAGGVFLLRHGGSVQDALHHASAMGIPVQRNIASWRTQPGWSSDTLATVPVAFAALREAGNFEGVVRLAISAGGDSDSIAAMAGGLAEARWGIPAPLAAPTCAALERAPSLQRVLQTFCQRFSVPAPHGKEQT